MAENRQVLIYTGDNEWSALYIDGELDTVGDHDVIQARIFGLFDIEHEFSNDFMRGGTDMDSVAQSLGAVALYKARREAAELEIRELKARITELRDRFQ